MFEDITWRDYAVLLSLVCIGAAIVFFGARGTKTKNARAETSARYEKLLMLEKFEAASVDGFYEFVGRYRSELSATAKKIDGLFPEELKRGLDGDGEKIRLIVMQDMFSEYVGHIALGYEPSPMKDDGTYCDAVRKTLQAGDVYRKFTVGADPEKSTIYAVFDVFSKCGSRCPGHIRTKTLMFLFLSSSETSKYKDLNARAFSLFMDAIKDSRFKATATDLIDGGGAE